MMARIVRPRAESNNALERLILDTYGGVSTASGVNITPDSAMRIGAVYSCVLVLSQSVAQLPLHLYRREGRDRVRVDEDPLSPLVGWQPNSWMTGYDWKQLSMVHLLLRGNSYWLKTRGTNRGLRELIPIHPDRIKGVVQDELYRIFYKVARSKTEVDTIPQDDILHFRGMSFDGIIGLNPIEYAREMMGLATAAEQHGAKTFANGARLAGILRHPGKLSKEAADRLEESFQENYAGIENAYKTAVLEEGMEYTRMAMTADDAQFLETRQYQRSEIAGFFRVPAHFINDLTHATFSNVEHLDLAFVKHSLTPWLVTIEQSLQRDLMSAEQKLDHYFKFAVDGILRGDTMTRSVAYQRAIMGGWMNPNEVRELEDRNPYEGGDEFQIPSNMMLVTEKENDDAETAQQQRP